MTTRMEGLHALRRGVTASHPCGVTIRPYPFMRDADGDGVVCDVSAVTMHPRFSGQIVAVISLCLTVSTACSSIRDQDAAVPIAATDCANWNSEEYFQAARVEDVADCLASGADLEARDNNGKTPLHLAAGTNENPAVITALLDAGADLEARHNGGLTPLHGAAVTNENPAVISALLDAGADLEARSKAGLMGQLWLYGRANNSLLSNIGIDLVPPSAEAQAAGMAERFPSAPARDGVGTTPLHLAAGD